MTYNSIFEKRTIRVFISSTFRDMVEDRNALMTHCWPELRRFCRERQVELVEVDLRWGIAEEQSTRKETLKLCLDEIRACRPFFIGLLGERYGWIPEDDAFTADLKEEQPWLNTIKGKSVTELEILHGVLNNPEMAGRAFFYFRDPIYIETVPKEKKADFLSETYADAEKQTELKNLIRKTCTEKGIPLKETYSNPQSLAVLVFEQLKAAIEHQFPIEDIPDPLTREARDHETFAESRRRTYIGRPDYFDALNKHCNDNGKPLVLLGDSGIGKSALLANWVGHWRKVKSSDYIFQHYIGGTSDSSDHWKLMRRLIGDIKLWTEDSEELPRSNNDVYRTFAIWIDKAQNKAESEGIKFIVIIDGINQFENKDNVNLLAWLPLDAFINHLRLIISTLPENIPDTLKNNEYQKLNIQPLTPVSCHRMISRYLGRYGKKLDKPRLRRLATTPIVANPLYLKILLDELRVTGTYDKLDERLDEYLSAKDIPALLKKVLARYQRDYENDRKGLVGEVLSLIWTARRGLTESELLQILKPIDLPQLPLAIWSPLRAALEDSLIESGGVINFAHNYLHHTIENTFIDRLERQKEYQLRLSSYFESQIISERTCDELPLLFKKLDLRKKLSKYLLNIDLFILIQKRDEDELLAYWIWLKEERIMGDLYIKAFDNWALSKKEPKSVNVVANDLAFFLAFRAELYREAEPLMRRALNYDKIILGANHPSVAIRHNNLGMLLQNIFRFKEAESQYLLAISIDENLGDNLSALSRDISNLATLLMVTNRYEDAEPLIIRALSIDEKYFGANHPIVAIRLGIQAELYQTTNRFFEAEPILRKALSIDERYYGPDHFNVANRLNSLALLLNDINRYGDAETLMRQALFISEQNFGLNHPKTAPFLETLAGFLINTGRLKESEPLVRRALAINEKIFAPNHPNIAHSLCLLANFYLVSNQLFEVESLLIKALAINEQFFGSIHEQVAANLNELGYFLKLTNRLLEAEPLLRRSLSIYEECFGSKHSKVSLVLSNLAQLLQALNRHKEAEKLMWQSLSAAEASLGPANPLVAICLNNLGQLFKVDNRLDEAEPLLRQALAILENSYGLEHSKVAIALNNIGGLLLNKGQIEEAEQCICRAIAINEKNLVSDHANQAFPLIALSELLHFSGRSSEAEVYCHRALDILVKSFGYNHPQVGMCLNRLGLISCALDKIIQSETQIKQSIEILINQPCSMGQMPSGLKTATRNYINILQIQGKKTDQIFQIITDISLVHGIDLTKVSGKIGKNPSDKLIQVIKSLLSNQSKTEELVANLKLKDYELYTELISWFKSQQ